jgi:hypothetical protein
MWGSIPAILLLQDFLNDPATKAIAFEYTFVVGLVALPGGHLNFPHPWPR